MATLCKKRMLVFASDGKNCTNQPWDWILRHVGRNPAPLSLTIPPEPPETAHKDVLSGGEWAPTSCRPLHRIAIVVPFRDRHCQLFQLLSHLLPLLKAQRLHFRLFVTEQAGGELFNKGALMNAAFAEAQKSFQPHCVWFHDVDMFPEKAETSYACPPEPVHLGAFVNSIGYRLMYPELAGGVLGLSSEHFVSVNGYSNGYWGWGGEDDDMGRRILHTLGRIHRPHKSITYMMADHEKRPRSNRKVLYAKLAQDGLDSGRDGLKQKPWRLLAIRLHPLFTHLTVDVGKAPSDWSPSPHP